MTRLLLVHAHPDDETLTCGITMAHHVAAGDDVHVLTCTLGEEGEVVPADLAHLEGAEGDPLGPWRRIELAEAMSRLGVEVSVLGEDPASGVLSRYRDSGMVGMPSFHHPRAFAATPVAEPAALVADHVRRLRPDVVVTYDPHGGYGHPDHVQAHRVTRAALASLEQQTRPQRAFEIRVPRSWAVEDRQWLHEHVAPRAGLVLPVADAPYPPGVVDDDEVSHVVVDPEQVPRQARALEAHATQLTVFPGPDGPCYALSNDIAARLPGREAFLRVDPATWQPVAAATGGGWTPGLLAD